MIGVTSSGNFENKKGWSGVKKHLDHSENLHHKNEFLNTEESKKLRVLNQHKVLIDYKKFTEDNFKSYVENHDENEPNQNKKYGSVEDFLKYDSKHQVRKIKPDQLFTEKFSDEKTYNSLLNKTAKLFMQTKSLHGKKLTKEQAMFFARKTFASGLAKYADGFNNRNSNLRMFEYYVHMDEKGAPHLHSRVMPVVIPTSKTKTGKIKKPSFSLNRALRVQFDCKSYKNEQGKVVAVNQANLKAFRKQEDQALVDAMNEAFLEMHVKADFKLIRKTDKDETLETGVDHDVYVAKQQKLDDLNSKIIAKSKKLNDLDSAYDKKKQEKQKEVDELNNDYNDLFDKFANVSKQQKQAETSRDKALKDAEKAKQEQKEAEAKTQQTRIDNANFIAQLNKQKAEQLKQQKALDKKEKTLTEREQNVSIRETNVTKREKKVNKFVDKLKLAVTQGYAEYFMMINTADIERENIEYIPRMVNLAGDKKNRLRNAKKCFKTQIEAKHFKRVAKSLINAVKVGLKVLDIDELDENLNDLDQLPDNFDSKPPKKLSQAFESDNSITIHERHKTSQKGYKEGLSKPQDLDLGNDL